jgi:hypothetical protein
MLCRLPGAASPTGSDPTAIGKANELAIEAAFSDNAPQDALKALEAKLAGQSRLLISSFRAVLHAAYIAL